MTSQLRSDTARANGAKSRGPKSPETRAKSAKNATKHGLTAVNTIILDCESTEHFHEIRDEFISMHHPATPAEYDLLDQMVVARWRLRRIWTAETALIDIEMVRRQQDIDKEFPGADPGVHLGLTIKSLADESRSLSLLSRYVARENRVYDRAYRTLRELQAERKAEGNMPAAQEPTQPEPPPQTPQSSPEQQQPEPTAPDPPVGQALVPVCPRPAPAANQPGTQRSESKDLRSPYTRNDKFRIEPKIGLGRSVDGVLRYMLR